MLLDDMAAYLQSTGVGQVTQTIFLHELPDGANAPDLCLMLREVGGLAPMVDHGSALATYERPGMQVLVRGAVRDYESARSMAEDAYQALMVIRNTVLSFTAYLAVTPLQSPLDLGSDANRRPLVGFTVVVEKELSV